MTHEEAIRRIEQMLNGPMIPGRAEALRMAIEALKAQPVRCKDCQFWQDNNVGYLSMNCRWIDDEMPGPDDYCSYGERKEQDE